MSRATDTGTGRLLPPVYLCLLNWLFASKTSLIGHRSVVQPAGVLLKLNRNFLYAGRQTPTLGFYRFGTIVPTDTASLPLPAGLAVC